MSDREDIDAVAAEFVLGTLDLSERASVAARRQREPSLDAAIEAWVRRLGPLHALAPEVEPPREIWSRLEAQLDAVAPLEGTKTAGASTGGAPVVQATVVGANAVELQRRLVRWRRFAMASAAIAASLLVIVGVQDAGRTPVPRNYVAVFQQNDALPAFLMTIDLETRQFTIRPVAAETPAGKAFQLWIVAEGQGGKPRSLGLVEDREATRAAVSSFDPAILRNATFGVSLEPAGGSPTGQPTGPVFHAKLLQTASR
jgi:anti-sigma-K factor RskA